MTPSSRHPIAQARDITLVCQECGGDLRPAPVAGSARCRFECQSCKQLFTWAESGWVRITA